MLQTYPLKRRQHDVTLKHIQLESWEWTHGRSDEKKHIKSQRSFGDWATQPELQWDASILEKQQAFGEPQCDGFIRHV